MGTYRFADEHTPPPAQQVTDTAITRFEQVFEVDPRLMVDTVIQQAFPNWDTLRIVNSRHDHLDWMHRHWAGEVVSGTAILEEISREDQPLAGPLATPPRAGSEQAILGTSTP